MLAMSSGRRHSSCSVRQCGLRNTDGESATGAILGCAVLVVSWCAVPETLMGVANARAAIASGDDYEAQDCQLCGKFSIAPLYPTRLTNSGGARRGHGRCPCRVRPPRAGWAAAGLPDEVP